MSAAGPPQGANCAPAFGGSAAAELANEAASVGVVWPHLIRALPGLRAIVERPTLLLGAAFT